MISSGSMTGLMLPCFRASVLTCFLASLLRCSHCAPVFLCLCASVLLCFCTSRCVGALFGVIVSSFCAGALILLSHTTKYGFIDFQESTHTSSGLFLAVSILEDAYQGQTWLRLCKKRIRTKDRLYEKVTNKR
jgi:hypothetical protein